MVKTDMVLVWYSYGMVWIGLAAWICMAWYGVGMVMLCYQYGIGMVFVRKCLMVLVGHSCMSCHVMQV